ncbi:sodium- and chloride-dependent glycine transporter 1-like isoform X1 [Diadema antillarum]|uniref:sodium- and chloride-dependent glycine transporter 1-like isoform X1 n=1 Tax=Diadema antillarum TaxID=105358 RepID=UPI003A83C380
MAFQNCDSHLEVSRTEEELKPLDGTDGSDRPNGEKPAVKSGPDGKYESLNPPVHPRDPADDDGNPSRGNWGSKIDFILSCVSYAVGIGNVWRFPFLCYQNGGGAFLIPYLIMLVVAGLPLFLLEMSFGQFTGVGCLGIWKICPMFKGIGYGMLVICFLVSIYYQVILAYTIFYLFSSLTSVLPWASCGHGWNTDNCTERVADGNTTFNISFLLNPKPPSEEYFYNHVLGMSDGIDEMGNVKWKLVLCLAGAWVITFLCLVKGIKTSGKVVYLTSTFPYLVLFILLVRGLTLDGAVDGIVFYMKPDISKLGRPQVWQDAATQIFFSLGVAFGSLHTLSSYNKWKNNCYRDALIVSVINCLTSIFAGFVIFSVLGFMAHEAGVSVKDIAQSGPGLAFVAYPEAIARMPLSPLWSILFFIMLFMLGLGSQFCQFETVNTGLADELEKYSKKFRTYKWMITATMSVICFLLGLPLVSEGGMYLVSLMNDFCGGLSLVFVGVFESIIISWIYGIDRYLDNVASMIGFRPNIYWKACWKYISPVFLVVVIIFSLVMYEPRKYGDHYTYPAWAEAMGWLMTLASLVPIAVYAVWFVSNQSGTLKERIRKSTRPAPDFGPVLNQHRKEAGFAPLPDPKAVDLDATTNTFV